MAPKVWSTASESYPLLLLTVSWVNSAPGTIHCSVIAHHSRRSGPATQPYINVNPCERQPDILTVSCQSPAKVWDPLHLGKARSSNMCKAPSRREEVKRWKKRDEGKDENKTTTTKEEKKGTESWKRGGDGRSNRSWGQNGKDEERQENVG